MTRRQKNQIAERLRAVYFKCKECKEPMSYWHGRTYSCRKCLSTCQLTAASYESVAGGTLPLVIEREDA